MFSVLFKKILRRSPPEKYPTSLGSLAIEKGFVSHKELVEALKVQEKRRRLGYIMVEMGLMTSDQLDELLFEQKIRRGRATSPEIIAFERNKKRRCFQELGTTIRDAAEASADFVNQVSELKAAGK